MDSVAVLGARSLFRAGLVDLLRGIGFDPIVEADDNEQMRRHFAANPPDDVLVIALARGPEAPPSIVCETLGWLPSAKLVCLVPEFDLEAMRASFAAGASGYLLESISRDALRESLQLVDAGEKVFPSELAMRIPVLTASAEIAEPASFAPVASELSSREVEILQCLARGQSNKAIAKDLEIAEATVKVHVKRILRKAHAMNRTQAALWGIARGVASPPGLAHSEAAAVG